MAGRKDNGDGSITKRADGRWEARATLPDGKRKSFYGKTKDEVKKRLEQVKRDIHAGLVVVPERQSIAQFLGEWLIGVKPQVSLGTWDNYHGYIYNHIVPAFGSVLLVKLVPQRVQGFYTTLLDSGLAPGTVSRIHSTLHRAFVDAVQFGLLQRNVLDFVKAPRTMHREMLTFSEEQMRQFLAGISGDRYEALYVLALTTGMRQGELIGLRWKDLDLGRSSLLVTMSAHKVGGKMTIGETKTPHSRRRIALSRLAVDALKRHRILQNLERLAAGSIWNDSLDLIFPNTIGSLSRRDYLAQQHFKGHLKRLGLPEMRFHDLRHTAATLLLARGVNVKVVSEMLGHSDISITLRVYGHVLPHMQRSAADSMDDMLS